MGKWTDNYKTYDPQTEGYGNKQQWKSAFYQRMSPEEAQEILNEDDPYVILGIKHGATKAEIKKAFYKMAKQWHPDHNPDNITKATEMMKKINAAYTILY